MYQKNLLIIICCSFFALKGFSQVVNLTQVIPDYYTSDILLKWNQPVTALGVLIPVTEYEYSLSINGAAYDPWISTGVALTITHILPAPPVINNMNTYSFRVRCKSVAGVWSAPSNIKSTNFSIVWPVRDVAGINEQVSLLNN